MVRTIAMRLALPLTAIGALVTGLPAVDHAQQPRNAAGVTVLQHARLVDGNGRLLSARGSIVLSDGRIAAAGDDARVTVPAGATLVDLSGRTVMPGLINTHGHVADTKGLQSGAQFYTEANLLDQLRLYARYGITTVASLGGDGEAGFRLRDAEAGASALDRSRLLVAGPVITADTPEAARREVDRVAAMKPNLIKIRVDDNLGSTRKMPIEVASAVIDQAHQRGLKVAVHIFYLDDAKALLRAGADFIAHSIRDKPVDDELIGLLKARNICVCPTLMREVSTFVYESEPDFFADPFFQRSADPAVLTALRDPARQAQMRASKSAQQYKAGLEIANQNLKKLFDAGVSIAFGTDTGPPARFQGYFEHLELDRMVGVGIKPADVVAIATGGSARCLGLTDIGHLQAGQRADVIVLDGDPLADIKAMHRLESIWIGGRRLGG
jgi:imidazolonepropionase-like amidohydrolase